MNEWGFALDNVTARWTGDRDGESILENISIDFRVRTGDIAALPLMGPSGHGKSTLLYLLAALKWPTAGTVTWDFPDGSRFSWGVESGGITQEQAGCLRRERFGFAFQSSTLSPYLTVLENLAYPLLLQGNAWKVAVDQAKERFREMLLPDENAIALLQRFPGQLSGGQRQRVALVQAGMHNPDVLFADEPTGQLDLHTRRQVMDVLLKWLSRKPGQRCLIWVTHHHLTDLDSMRVNNMLFVENRRCVRRNREWLNEWVRQIEEKA